MLVGVNRVLNTTGDLGLTYAYVGFIAVAMIALPIYVKRRQ
ncbi:MAG TPA: hypothetical protein VK204_04550 [Nocardioidaceae bacterium]|nr:hypothetical protein [Nocardioidaceae bacterium]